MQFWYNDFMARRSIHKRHIRNLQKDQRTYSVSIPVEIIRELKWQDKQRLVVEKWGKTKIIIQDWPVRKAKRKK